MLHALWRRCSCSSFIQAVFIHPLIQHFVPSFLHPSIHPALPSFLPSTLHAFIIISFLPPSIHPLIHSLLQVDTPGFAITGEQIPIECQITAPDGATGLALTLTASYREGGPAPQLHPAPSSSSSLGRYGGSGMQRG